MKRSFTIETAEASSVEKIRILFLADTHIGYDWPQRPRVDRRRRGEDFLENYYSALELALKSNIDLVIHGGDLFHRSKPRQEVVFSAFRPLHQIAEMGIPILIVPGNHERSNIPYPLLTIHPRIHIFRKPESIFIQKAERMLEIAGIPQVRRGIRERFPQLIRTIEAETDPSLPARLLCIHQAVEGATVGPSEFVFRGGPDVIAAEQIPDNLLAVLSGHIHRAQILLRGITGISMKSPVFYPGSTDRTSFAERNEVKGFLTFEVDFSSPGKPCLANVEFHQIPCRPMRTVTLSRTTDWKNSLQAELKELPDESIVQIRLAEPPERFKGLTGKALRSLASPKMSVVLRVAGRIH